MENYEKEKGKVLILSFLNDEMLIGIMCGCCISFIVDETIPLWLKISLGISVLFGPIITQLAYCTALFEYRDEKKANDISMLSVLNFLVFLFPPIIIKKGILLIICNIILLSLMLYFNHLNVFGKKKIKNDKR